MYLPSLCELYPHTQGIIEFKYVIWQISNEIRSRPWLSITTNITRRRRSEHDVPPGGRSNTIFIWSGLAKISNLNQIKHLSLIFRTCGGLWNTLTTPGECNKQNQTMGDETGKITCVLKQIFQGKRRGRICSLTETQGT